MSETNIMRNIMKKATRLACRLFRNQAGVSYQGMVVYKDKEKVILKNWRIMRSGLVNGAGDLIGWRTTIITPDMVGKRIAVFASVEVKSKDGRMSKEQKQWHAVLKMVGAISGVARSDEDAEAILMGGLGVPDLPQPE